MCQREFNCGDFAHGETRNALDKSFANGTPIQGRRSVGGLDSAAVFWRSKHAEAAIGLYVRRQNVKTSQIRIVEVGDKILGVGPTA